MGTLAIGAALAQADPLAEVRFDLIAENIPEPTSIVAAPDASGRLFVLERSGRIRVVEGRHLQDEPFLDIEDRVTSVGHEQGLLGIAFDPDYASSGLFFVHYTGENGRNVLARYSVSPDASRADAASEEIFLSVEQPLPTHNGGQIAFGPDGYLYLGVGDGGVHEDAENQGQSLSTQLGKILRLDVAGDPPARPATGNPFASQPGTMPEIWAYGLRNPWRFSFDRLTGDLFIGDVGQQSREEIDFLPAGVGGHNFGWRRMEGAACFDPASDCDDGLLAAPILEYSHASGCSVTGGYRYRGAASPALEGLYFFGDFCTGALWAGREEDGTWATLGPAPTGFSISTFGEDADGELLVADFATGKIYRFTGEAPPAISEGGVVNGASFASGEPVAPGSIISIFGVGLAEAAASAAEGAEPALSGVQVSIGGHLAPIYAVFPRQINAQVPWELPSEGEAEVAVTVHGSTLPSRLVRLSRVAPAVFTLDKRGQAAALIAGTDVVAAPAASATSRPARRGEAVSLFATGLGPVANQPSTGASAPSEPLAFTLEEPLVTVGDVAVPVLYSGLAPGYAGLYQVNVELVGAVPSGDAVPLRLEIGGRQAPPVTIAVE